jgi:transcriptional regulator with XRE-family HTH domain
MNDVSSARHRPTDTIREGHRLTRSIADALGRAVRQARLQRRMSQRRLGAEVGVHQSQISRIELGRGHGVPLELWVAIGTALGRPLAISLSRPLGEPRQPQDAGHLAMQEMLLARARATGRTATFELPTRPADPSHSIDVCVRDARHRVLIVEEAWNTFGDVGAAVRSTNRKVAEAADLAATIDGERPYRVASVWVVRPSAANRTLIAGYPQVFASACPGPSRAWARALTDGGTPPTIPGLVWLDPTTGAITEWRQAHPHASRAPHRPPTASSGSIPRPVRSQNGDDIDPSSEPIFSPDVEKPNPAPFYG